jgi:hypothetical protein
MMTAKSPMKLQIRPVSPAAKSSLAVWKAMIEPAELVLAKVSRMMTFSQVEWPCSRQITTPREVVHKFRGGVCSVSRRKQHVLTSVLGKLDRVILYPPLTKSLAIA